MGSRGFAYNSACNDSDGQNFCDCQLQHTNNAYRKKCMHFGRHVEPLAFSLKPSTVDQQKDCPFFSILAAELRETIYEYAFTDCTSHPPNADNPIRRSNANILPPCDIALNLLQTCKAIYLEAYRLPFLLNPFTVYTLGHLPSYDISRPKFARLAPWQFALIQSVDLSLQQVCLEGNKMADYLTTWRAKERHQGAVIAPRFYQETRHIYPGNVLQSFNFGLMSVTPCKDGVPVSLATSPHFYPQRKLNDPGFSTNRVMVARPITRLTIRMSRTDWWTWADYPSSTAVNQLGLDPAFGDGGSNDNERPVQPRMLHLAAERQAGRWPNPYYKDPAPTRYVGTWGAVIAKLPDLKVLELVLETFSGKKAQLDSVIDCARLWRFPLDPDSGKEQWELVWDGKVGVENWKFEKVYEGNHSYEDEFGEEWMRDRDVEVRVIRFVRRKMERC